MPLRTIFAPSPDDHAIERAQQLLTELTDYLKADMPGFYRRYSDLRRIEVDRQTYAALTHLGLTRNTFARHRVLVLDDVFLHMEIVDGLGACDGFRFVFCEPYALRVTERRPAPADDAQRRLAS